MDIPGGNYKYELSDKSCTNIEITTDYYYDKGNGVFKYAQASDCKDLNYKYIKGHECKRNCDDNYYKLDKAITISGTSENFIKCFDNPNGCLNARNSNSNKIYYNQNLKQCWEGISGMTGIPNTYYIKEISTDLYELVDECELFYYTNTDGYKYCISDCNTNPITTNKYFISGNKKCLSLEDCSDQHYYFYDDSNKECLDTCKKISKFQKELTNPPPLTAINCLSSCPDNDPDNHYPYYNYDSNICLSHCGADGSNNKYHAYGSKICYPSCLNIPNGNYIYETEDTSIYTCHISPPTGCDYYYIRNDGSRKCTTPADCRDNNKIYILGKECKDSCESDYYKLDIEINISTDSTPNNKPFIKCFQTVDDCFNYVNEGITSPTPVNNIYYYERIKKCWKVFPNDYYIKDKESTNNNKYELVDKCDKYYYVDDTISENICTNDCKSVTPTGLYFVSGSQKCLTSCDKKYYDPDNNECLDSCEGRPKYKYQKKNEGSTPMECLETCPTDSYQYHDFDSNICIQNCGEGDPNKKVHAVGKYICYTSCSEIPGGEYTYENGGVCYTSSSALTSCDYFYLKANGDKLCTTINNCISNKKNYFILGETNSTYECKDNCDGYFKREATHASPEIKITYCYESLRIIQLDSNVKYYNIKSKLCWKEYPTGYYILPSAPESTQFEVVDECQNFYYKGYDTFGNTNEYYCTEKCKVDGGINLFFVNGQKNCESSCDKFNKHFKDGTNNECLDTCKGRRGKEYAKYISGTGDTLLYECIEACSTSTPLGFRDYDSNICIEKCGLDKNNYLYHANTGNICYPSCKDIQEGDYIYESKDPDSTGSNIYTCYITSPTDPDDSSISLCPFYYKKKDGTLKCLENEAKCLELDYHYLFGKECRSECNDFFILEDDSSDGLIKCFKTKDNCMNDGHATYFNTRLKKCWINYPNDYFMKDGTQTSDIEMLEECEYYYYRNTITVTPPGTDYVQYICTNNCKSITSIISTGLFYDTGKKNCEESCSAFGKYYYDPNRNECLDTCIGHNNNLEFADFIDFQSTSPSPSPTPTECKSGCDPSNQVYNFGSKICLNACDLTSKFVYKKFNNADNICYDSCAQIPGGKYIYESETGNICYQKSEIDSTNCRIHYPQNDGTMKCVGSTSASSFNCKSEGFDYILGNECRTNCDNYYKLMDEGGVNTKECFKTLKEVKDPSKNIHYYDISLKQCWINYPSDFYIKDKDESGKYEVVEDCDKFYYEVNPPTKYCIDDCKSKNLNYFFEQGNNKCQSSCTGFNKKYYDPTNNECLDTCLHRNNLEYSFPYDTSTNMPQACLEKCPNDKYFITQRDSTDNSITNYICVNSCPYDANNDGNNEYIYLDIKTKECLTSTSNDNCLLNNDDNICYPKCDVNRGYRYINTDTYECVLACPSELKKLVKIGTIDTKDVFLCKSLCEDPLEFRLGDQCVEKCPQTHPYIGYNNICRASKCTEDANGEHYYPINEDTYDPSNGDYLIYKCIDSCNEAIIDASTAANNYLYYTKTDPNQCLRECPPTAKNYLASNDKECLSECPDEIPFFNNDYECKVNTVCDTEPNIYFLNGVCVDNCLDNGKLYIDSRNICMDKCPENEIKQKMGTSESYQCRKNCGNDYIFKENAGDEPQCVTDCPPGLPYIGKDNVCKTSCGEEDGTFRYIKKEINDPTADPPVNYKIYQCVDGCKSEYEGYQYRRVDDDGKNCYKECPEHFEYLSSEENLCYDDCLKSEHNKFRLITQDNTGNEIKICTTQCDDATNKYYGENKVCVSDCNLLGPNKLIDGNICVDKCGELDTTNIYQLYNKCVADCSVDTNTPKRLRYSKIDYKCKLQCGTGEYLIQETNECVNTCNDFIDILLDSSGTPTGEKACIHSCQSIGKYYYPSKKMCITKCDYNDKVVDGLNMCVNNCNEIKSLIQTDDDYYLLAGEGTYSDGSTYDKCVKECPSNKPYIDNDECIDRCPNERKYFIKSDINPDKKCLNDCPGEYPYYTEENDANNNPSFPCEAECPGYYIPNGDVNINAKLCLSNCPDTTHTQYKYKLIYEKNNEEMRECYSTCPSKAKYHFDIEITPTITDNTCYEKCPQETPYNKIGETICLKQSELIDGGYLLYDIKEWVITLSKCPEGYTFTSTISEGGNDVIICLKECNFEYYDTTNNIYIRYAYLTPYNTCVEDCETSSSVSNMHLINDISNELSKKCICKNLYYISESTSYMTCYDPSITSCQTTTSPNYPYPLHGSKQCLKTCKDNRILNPSEDECFKANTPCSSIDANSILVTTSTGQMKCDCAFRFYYDTGNKKHCLAESDYCFSGSYNLYIPELKECISACPANYPMQFKNFCLKNCPSGTVKVGSECKCDKDTNDKYWYQTSESNYICLEGDCPDNFPVYVESTKQCLTSCIGTQYPNLFENKCYEDCTLTGIPNIEPMVLSSSLALFKCDCARPWYYDPSENIKINCPPNDGSITRCEDYTEKDFKYYVEETRQCVKECPPEYPYFFNNKCYTTCEHANDIYGLNIESVESSFECTCQNLWYKENTIYKDKICYPKYIEECPILNDPSTRYLIHSTKQCVNSREECPTNSYKFNYICYDKCPEYTLEAKETLSDGREDNICTCNVIDFLYLDYEKYGNKYYKCGLDACPEVFIDGEQEEVRKNLLEREHKCVKSCLDDGKEDNEYTKGFRNICRKECPSQTRLDYDECTFYEPTDEDNVHDLYELKNAANIQAKELYEGSGSMSGYLLNKYDSSLQIYALNKLNDYKDLTMKSNLTYIDLGSCLEKIYQDNNLKDDDKILVNKYDLLTRNHKQNNNNEIEDNDNTEDKSIDDKYLINQVEYEFYLERTMEKIEGSICAPYEIAISYPIAFNKNRFNKFDGGINDNNYLKKFQIGKELHRKDHEIDTFNKENKVYKDICIGVELNGRDLVLEERYDYLYPNNISLCESNCTMKNTDFDLERINCMCTYKEIFDFNRKDEDTNDIINDPNFHKTTQSSANAEIIKCLPKIEIKQGIIKNQAFYFSSVVILVELSMAVVSAIHGIKAVAGFMKGMLGMNKANQVMNYNKTNPVINST